MNDGMVCMDTIMSTCTRTQFPARQEQAILGRGGSSSGPMILLAYAPGGCVTSSPCGLAISPVSGLPEDMFVAIVTDVFPVIETLFWMVDSNHGS